MHNSYKKRLSNLNSCYETCLKMCDYWRKNCRNNETMTSCDIDNQMLKKLVYLKKAYEAIRSLILVIENADRDRIINNMSIAIGTLYNALMSERENIKADLSFFGIFKQMYVVLKSMEPSIETKNNLNQEIHEIDNEISTCILQVKNHQPPIFLGKRSHRARTPTTCRNEILQKPNIPDKQLPPKKRKSMRKLTHFGVKSAKVVRRGEI